jgi:hypothetical protein
VVVRYGIFADKIRYRGTGTGTVLVLVKNSPLAFYTLFFGQNILFFGQTTINKANVLYLAQVFSIQVNMKSLLLVFHTLVMLLLLKAHNSSELNGTENGQHSEPELATTKPSLETQHSGKDNTFTKENVNSSEPRNSSPNLTAKLEYERVMKAKEEEAMRVRKHESRKQESLNAARRTIHAASTDQCDWKSQPMAYINGEVCGSHYKVLGIDRKSKLADKSSIKRRYRQLTLYLHPDKNPATEAEDAFNVLQSAYNCILDDSCKEEYDQKLAIAEEEIYFNRQKMRKMAIEKSVIAFNQAHYYISLSANRFYQISMNFWDKVGDWRVTVYGESYPLGRPLALLALLWKGQFLLKLHALSYFIIRVNNELAKSQGWL